MNENGYGLILASGSPRRIELIQRLEVHYTVEPSTIDESLIDINLKDGNLEPCEIFAKAKCLDVAKRHPDSFVMGLDTMVIIDNMVLGKPRSENDAFNMLRVLSGREHEVLTGVCVYSPITKDIKVDFDLSRITFKQLSDNVIRKYIATGEPMDKAGAYGIQGIGRQLVENYKGNLSNVVGFPLPTVYVLLCESGFMSSI